MGSSASVLTSVLGSRNIHIVTGHTHNINNVSVSGSVYEHNAGALCASWWWTGRYSITSEASWGGGTSLSDTYHIGRDGALRRSKVAVTLQLRQDIFLVPYEPFDIR